MWVAAERAVVSSPPLALSATRKLPVKHAKKRAKLNSPPFACFAGKSKQLANWLRSIVHQRERASIGAGQFGGQVEAETVVNRGHDFGGINRTLHRISADFIALADHAAAFDAATREINRPALRPMIASASGIGLRGPTELG